MTIETKEDNSYVTSVDKQVSDDLTTLFSKEFSDSCIISEENKDRDFSKKDLFTVDPIDGTENFINGLPFYGVSISHYQNMQHDSSILYFPSLGNIISSAYNIIKPETMSRIVTLSSSLSIEEIQKYATNKEFEEYRIIGCATYNLFGVITGMFKSYFSPRVHSWDILAGINIAIKNGINVEINGEKWNGEFLEPDCKFSCKVWA
jgi:myo-inositol-1(or 4)-monophosphatase